MPIRFKIFLACVLLTLVTASIGVFALSGERRLGGVAVQMYDEALTSVSFMRGAATKFETLRGRYLVAAVAAKQAGAAAAGFDASAASDAFGEVSDELDVVVERATSPKARAAAQALEARIEGIAIQAADVQATVAKLTDAAPAFDAAVELFAQDGFDYRTHATQILAASIRQTYIALGVALAAAIAITLALTQVIVPDLRRATLIAQAVAGGKLDNTMPRRTGRRSETTQLLRALDSMQSSISGNLVRIEAMRRDEDEQRSRADLEQRSNEAGRAEAATLLSGVVADLARALDRLSSGDLTFRLEQSFPADYEQLRTDFNGAISQLEGMIRGLAINTTALGTGADEIARASSDLARRTEVQAASLEETAATLDSITSTVATTANGAKQARAIVARTQVAAEQSGTVMRRAAAAMANIEESSNKVGQILGVIDEIAFQTNLLALNAGIEAARVGDAGRGFAVVAQEVRALSQRSAQSARDIKALIATSTEQIGEGVALVGETGQALTQIISQIAEISAVVAIIADSAQNQAAALNEINTAVGHMDQATQQTAAMVEQSTAASTAIAQETAELVGLAQRFHIGAASAPAAPSNVAPLPRRAETHRTVALRVVEQQAADGWEEF